MSLIPKFELDNELIILHLIFSNEAMIRGNKGFCNKLKDYVDLMNLAEIDSRVKVKVKNHKFVAF